jgi:L-seryl-tRNA(Ser) seleniumtransferase
MDMLTLRSLPSVDQVLQAPAFVALVESYGRPLVLEAVRQTLETARRDYPESGSLPDISGIQRRVQALIDEWVAPTLQPVINATGVILQTNLGRAPLSSAAMQAATQAGLGYSTLEYDVAKGKRGSRLVHAEKLLRRLTGAEAAMVVNNNAAAVLLALTALARRRAVVIARSQLVEIGGGFRIPDVMKQSGARLVEIGTTNRVHLRDFEESLQQKPALFLRAHRSNFRILGFTSEPELGEIAALAHREGITVVDDLGSGSLLDTARYGLGHEPMVQESLQAGADLVCFSGDKLLGGPQAGIIVGKAALVAKLSKHPLARAIRSDKLCLAALTATLLHYLKDEAETAVPVWRMISAHLEDIQLRVDRWAEALGAGEVVSGESTVGGGSLPGETLPTRLLSLNFRSPDRALEKLRRQHPPVIARTQADRVLLDPRTVLPEQEAILIAALKDIMDK